MEVILTIIKSIAILAFQIEMNELNNQHFFLNTTKVSHSSICLFGEFGLNKIFVSFGKYPIFCVDLNYILANSFLLIAEIHFLLLSR